VKQTFVWLGHGAPSLTNLTAAAPTRFSSVPAVSNLLGSTDAASLAQRLGARFADAKRLPHSAHKAPRCRAAFDARCALGACAACACNSYEDGSRCRRVLQHSRQLAAAAGAPAAPSSAVRCAASLIVSLLTRHLRFCVQAVAEKYLVRLLQPVRAD
jgi:hypothetical protein